MCLQLLALEDMGVKAEDLVMYSQVEVCQFQSPYFAKQFSSHQPMPRSSAGLPAYSACLMTLI